MNQEASRNGPAKGRASRIVYMRQALTVSEGAVCEHVVVLGVEEEKVVAVDEELEVFTTGRIPAPGCALSAASMTLLQQQVPQQSGLAATATGGFTNFVQN